MINCASVSLFMGPYINNYVLSELALDARFRAEGNRLIHIFPKDVENYEWVPLFREQGSTLYFVEVCPRTWRSISTFRKIFNKEHINLIHVHFGGWDIDTKIAAPTIPAVWHQRMSVNLDTCKRRFYHNLMYKVIGRYKTHHIAISDSVYQAIQSLTNNKTYIINNGVDFSKLHLKSKAGLFNNCSLTKVLMFAFSPLGKGFDIAYRACEIINRENIRVELDVVTQRKTNAYIEENIPQIPSWLKILPPTSSVADYFDNADIFLSASRSEGFCNSLLESIYCGCPAIYSDISGTRWASQFHNTFMYEVESPESLVKAIEQCISTPINIEDVEQNRKLAQERYSLEAWVNKVYPALMESAQM